MKRIWRRRGTPLELTPADLLPRREGGPASLGLLASEIDSVARYVERLKRAVAALRPGTMAAKSVAGIREDLRRTRRDAEAAVETIVEAAEAILDYDGPEDDFRDMVRTRLTTILEACSFHDTGGQRLARADAGLDGMAERLTRFVDTVRIADGDAGYHRRAVLDDVRREVLLVEGPQAEDTPQGAIDRLFA